MPKPKVKAHYYETNRLQGMANNPVAVACLNDSRVKHSTRWHSAIIALDLPDISNDY